MLRSNSITTKTTSYADANFFQFENLTRNFTKILNLQNNYSRTVVTGQHLRRFLFDIFNESRREAALTQNFNDETTIVSLSPSDTFLITLMLNMRQLDNLTAIAKHTVFLTPYAMLNNYSGFSLKNSPIEFDETDDEGFTTDLNNVVSCSELLLTTISFFKKNQN